MTNDDGQYCCPYCFQYPIEIFEDALMIDGVEKQRLTLACSCEARFKAYATVRSGVYMEPLSVLRSAVTKHWNARAFGVAWLCNEYNKLQ
jgi:hypothetical protein